MPVALASDVVARELAEPDTAAALRVLCHSLSRHPHGPRAVSLPWRPVAGPIRRWPAYVAELPGGAITATAVPAQVCHRPGRDGCCRVCRDWPPTWAVRVGLTFIPENLPNG